MPGNRIYLNNAASSWPKAPGLAAAVARALEETPAHPGRSGFSGPDHAEECRVRLADLLGAADPSRVVLTGNATHALNLALLGFPFERGDLVLTSQAEHNSVLRPLYRLRRLGTIRLKIAPCGMDGRIDDSAFQTLLEEERPRLVVLGHASNVTGAIHQIRPLFSAAREKGAVTLLDAAQTAGLVEVRARGLAADMIALTGHKYLLGPPGTGALYAGPEVELDPVLVGGTGVRSDLETMPPEMPCRLEAGTPNLPAWAGLRQALDWSARNPHDPSALEKTVLELEQGLRHLGARVVAVRAPRTPLVSFQLAGWPPEEAAFALEKGFALACRAGLHCAPLIHPAIGTAPTGTIRFSLSRFTTPEQVERALEGVERLAGSLVA